MNILEDWRRRGAVLVTMHGKEKVVAPLFRDLLGVSVIVPANFNTDKFGTFTRDVVRAGNQLEAARKKALAVADVIGADLVLASEGSFSSHPQLPFVQSNLELMLLIDIKNNLEIRGHYRGSASFVKGVVVHSSDEALETALAWGFPAQGVILRQSQQNMNRVYKNISTPGELSSVAKMLCSGWFTKSCYLETDLRAHRCPSRMHAIAEATQDLITNCLSRCPLCTAPGFVITSYEKGLPCELCGLPTDCIKSSIKTCGKCSYTETFQVADVCADAGQCAYCNP